MKFLVMTQLLLMMTLELVIDLNMIEHNQINQFTGKNLISFIL